MKRDWCLRWGWLIALASGLAWILPISMGRISPDEDSWDCNSSWDYVLNAIDPIKFFLTAAAIWALYTAQRANSSSTYLRWAAVCLLYTSDAADDLLCVDLGGRRIIKKKKK